MLSDLLQCFWKVTRITAVFLLTRGIRKAVETISWHAVLDSPDLSYFYRLFARNCTWADQGRANANMSKEAFASYITDELLSYKSGQKTTHPLRNVKAHQTTTARYNPKQDLSYSHPHILSLKIRFSIVTWQLKDRNGGATRGRC